MTILFNILAIVTMLIAFALVREVLNGNGDIAYAAGFFIAALFFGFLASSSRETKRKSDQLLKNKEAPEILVTDKEFLLYLRPFNSEKSIVIDNSTTTEKVVGLLPGSLEKDFVDFEYYLSSALENRSKIHAIGSPNNTIGAAKLIIPDEGWVAIFHDLSSRANAIFVLPFYMPSTAYEIKWLKDNNLFGKVVFVMPGDAPFGIVGEDWNAENMFDVEWVNERWEKDRKKYIELGIFLPKYKDNGMLFQLDEKGDSIRVAALGKTELRKSYDLINSN